MRNRRRGLFNSDRDQGQAMLAVVLGICLVMVMIPLGVVALLNGQASLTTEGQSLKAAVQAAEAGIADYQNHLNSYTSSTGGYGSAYCSNLTFTATGDKCPTGTAIPDPSPSPATTSSISLTDPGYVEQLDTTGCSNPTSRWALASGSTGGYHTGYQYVVDSSHATTAPYTVYVYATGHAGSGKEMACASVKAALTDHEGATVSSTTVGTCGSGIETAQGPSTTSSGETITINLNGASGATGGSTINDANGGGNGGDGQMLQAMFVVPTPPGSSAPTYGVTIGCTGGLGKAGQGFTDGGGAGHGGGGGGASAFCFEGNLSGYYLVCSPNQPTSGYTCPTGDSYWPGTYGTTHPCTSAPPTGTPECPKTIVWTTNTTGPSANGDTVPCVLAIAAAGGGGGEGRCSGDNSGYGGVGGGTTEGLLSNVNGTPYYDAGTTSSTTPTQVHNSNAAGNGGGGGATQASTGVPGVGGTGGTGSGNRPSGAAGDGPGPFDTPPAQSPYVVGAPAGYGGTGTQQNASGGQSGGGGSGWVGGGSGGSGKDCGAGGGGGGGESMVSPAAITNTAYTCTNPPTTGSSCTVSGTAQGSGNSWIGTGSGYANMTWNSATLGNDSASEITDTCTTSNASIETSTKVPSTASSLQFTLAGGSGAEGSTSPGTPGVGGKGDELQQFIATSGLPSSSTLPYLTSVTGCAGQSAYSSNPAAGGAGFTAGGAGGTANAVAGAEPAGGGGGSSAVCLTTTSSGSCTRSLSQCTAASTTNCVLAVAGGGGGGGVACVSAAGANGGAGGTPETSSGSGTNGSPTTGDYGTAGGGGTSLAGGSAGANGGNKGKTNPTAGSSTTGGSGASSNAAAEASGGGGGGGWYGGGGGGAGQGSGNSACTNGNAGGGGGGGAGSSLQYAVLVANSTWKSGNTILSTTNTPNFLTSGVYVGMIVSGTNIKAGSVVQGVTATQVTVPSGTVTGGNNSGTLTFTAPTSAVTSSGTTTATAATVQATPGYGDGSVAITWSSSSVFGFPNVFPSFGDDCGDPQTFAVPSGTTDITATVSGGVGAPFGSSKAGGAGAAITSADLADTFTSGSSTETIANYVTVVLGCSGSLAMNTPHGAPGSEVGGLGGNQDTGSDYSGGGGGASAVCLGQFCNINSDPLNASSSYTVPTTSSTTYGANTTLGSGWVGTAATNTVPCPSTSVLDANTPSLSNGDGTANDYFGCVAVVAGGGGGAGSATGATGGAAGATGLTAGGVIQGSNGGGTTGTAGSGGQLTSATACTGGVDTSPANTPVGCSGNGGDGGGGFDPSAASCMNTGCANIYGGGGSGSTGTSGYDGGGGGASFLSSLDQSLTSSAASSTGGSISLVFSESALSSKSTNFGCNGLSLVSAGENGTAGITLQGGSGDAGGSNPATTQGLAAEIIASFDVSAGQEIGVIFGCPGVQTGDPNFPQSGEGFTTSADIGSAISGQRGGNNGGNGGGAGAVCLFDDSADATLSNCNSSTPVCTAAPPVLTSASPSCIVFVAGGGGGGGAKAGQGNSPHDGFGGFGGGVECESYLPGSAITGSDGGLQYCSTTAFQSCNTASNATACTATVYPGQPGSTGTGNYAGGAGGGDNISGGLDCSGTSSTYVNNDNSGTAIGCYGQTFAGDGGGGGGGYNATSTGGGGGGGGASTSGGYGGGGGGGASYISADVTSAQFEDANPSGTQQTNGQSSSVSIAASSVSSLAIDPEPYNSTVW